MAEMACSHDGSIENVKKMISDIAESGADGIQFQIFSTDQLLIPTHPFYKKVKSLEIPLKDWEHLINLASDKKLSISINILDQTALPLTLSEKVDFIKTHSADLSNPEVIRKVGNSGKPVIISTGGSTLVEINTAITELKNTKFSDIILMHGFQAFPTQFEDSHLNFIETLKKQFNYPVGYQDHVAGDHEMARIIPLLAMAKGSIFIEKHITDDRSRKGTDYESAINSSGFKNFVDLVEDAWKTFGSEEERSFSQAEIKYRKTFKKSLIASRDIAANERLDDSMILIMRGEQGISPNKKSEIIGRVCNRAIKKYESFQLEYLK
mgnify:CR=1 FL=1